MDEAWTQVGNVDAQDVLIIIEGLTMYLTENDIRQILTIISEHFRHASIIVEIMNPFIVKHFKEKSIEKSQARFSWGIHSGKQLEAFAPNLHWIEDVSLAEGMKVFYPIYRVLCRISFIRNFSNKLAVLKIS